MKTISVVGLGYIGLPTAAVFADHQANVIGVDINQAAVDTINQGEIHIVEPGLEQVVKKAVGAGRLRAVTRPEPADAFLIAVPTPFTNDRQPDLRHIEAASKAIAPVLKSGDIVILESTSPVGATERMAGWLAESRPDLSFARRGMADGEKTDVHIAHCPERVLPGHVLRELVENDRVIGGMTPACSQKAAEVYNIFLKGGAVITDVRTAEMCKLTENAFRDVNIAFANELSIICEKQGINVWELIGLANRHPRVNILKPGCGVGGHCIAVDPWFIVSSHPQEAQLIRTARETNDNKPKWVLSRMREAVAATGKAADDVAVAVLGLAFKPDIDDLRESPALAIAAEIGAVHTGEILVVEPYIERLPPQIKRGTKTGTAEAVARADIVLILVAHSEFSAVSGLLRPGQAVIDAAGVVSRGA